MNALDYLILLILGLSAALSLWRGFVREVISLLGLVAAFWIASRASPIAADWFSHWIRFQPLAELAGFVFVFVLVSFAAGLIGALAGKLVDAAHLTATDRMLGMLFGLVRGALLVGLAFLAYTSVVSQEPSWMRASRLAPYGKAIGAWIGGLIPAGFPLSRQPADVPELDRRKLERLLKEQMGR
ncbi:MAG: CvpA family protein [Zetaproteobacteria bacterium]|nr:MAG: CvpA family protein [Zetaproteobacteria bacterium]